jgi:uncharacterized 2Fe-2S/4Fe-4S cluster protein (DUF4445 family)
MTSSPSPVTDRVRLELLPLGRILELAPGTPLRGVLFEQGVEFPCGGRGRCKGCRVRVLRGTLPVTLADTQRLSDAELAAGWRLACSARADTDLSLELAQWEAAILTDDSTFAFAPRKGFGVAIDVGTTTLVAQLLDLSSANVLAVRSSLNPQAEYGADIMSRIEFSVSDRGATLTKLIRRQVGGMVSDLLGSAGVDPADLREILLAGNTAMHHLFCGLDAAPLAHYPFEPKEDGVQTLAPELLGWDLPASVKVRFLPCLGGFVGSDILAGILATGLQESDGPAALVDLGTNGEMVVGRRGRLLCASTAAGPAFEGARISCGMRAATGAISAVRLEDGVCRCEVIGGGPARGICGSGLVDAVAAGLELNQVQPSGRLTSAQYLLLTSGVSLTQADIRELQLAKGAIAAGLRILLKHLGLSPEEVVKVHLAGAFGNYISRASARRIGLLPFPLEKVVPAGNTALLGAKLALFGQGDPDRAFVDLRAQVRHVSLHEDPDFQDIFGEEMVFPGIQR